MNNTSPLVPQGAIPPRPKNSLYFKILMVLSLHVVIIGGMLLQGCKDTSNTATNKPQDPGASVVDLGNGTNSTTLPVGTITNDLVTGMSLSNQQNSMTPPLQPVATPIVSTSAPVVTSAIVPPVSVPVTPVAPTGETHDYVVAKGDTLAVIAHKNGVSLKSLEEANQGVNPRKMHVGQKLVIPSAGAVASSATPSTAGAMKVASMSASADGDLYVVKSGDTLSKIAKSHGVSFKKIMAMNDLKTTSIHAGQKLKMPAAKAASEPSTPSNTVPVTTTPGMKVSSVSSSATPLAKN